MLKAILDYFGIKITYDDEVVEKKDLSESFSEAINKNKVKKKSLSEDDAKFLKSVTPASNVFIDRFGRDRMYITGSGYASVRQKFNAWIKANNMNKEQIEFVNVVRDYTIENRFLSYGEMMTIFSKLPFPLYHQQAVELVKLNNEAHHD